MKSKNEENNNNDIKDETQKPNEDNNLNRLDSPNTNDNETNKILEKEEKNNIIEFDHSTNISKENQKKSFFHDKDITEDSIIYFSNKLKQSNNSYKISLYISILIYIFDIIIWFISENILHNYFNLFSIIIILISSLYQAFKFRHDFESISKELYNFIQKIIYIYNSIVILFLINVLYIIYFQIFKNTNNSFFDFPLIILSYIGINVIIPIIASFKLLSVKKSIKNLSAAKGEIYESSRYEEVQVINSVINEI